jgi:hypothetical protein
MSIDENRCAGPEVNVHLVVSHTNSTVDYLIKTGKLEFVEATSGDVSTLLTRASKRLETARSAERNEDYDGALSSAYDVYRMSGDALLLQQKLRATGGQAGSHMAIEDAV